MDRVYGEVMLGGHEVLYRCHYRVWAQPPMLSSVAVSNCGAPETNQKTAS